MSQIEFYHDSLERDGCQLFDEYNQCCMLDRIETIVTDPKIESYPWEKAGESTCIDG